jgi:DNA primase
MIDNLKDKIVLSDELSKHLKLKKNGDLFWSCCPFHEEKSPSFVINNEKKFYYCFGCGVHGDIFAFYKNYLNKTFSEALHELAPAYGIKINTKTKDINNECQAILDVALIIYQENLQKNQHALEYLKKRNISGETIEKFQLGYADGSIVIENLINKGFSLEHIKEAGLNSYGGLDRFRNRIIFPIISKSQKIIGFAGRVLDNSEPKYLNSPETPLFQKNLHLFNEQNFQPKLPSILVEGYIDVISMTQLGFPNVIASMGTSLSPGQVLSIFRNSNTLYLMFDGDKAGQDAINRNINVCLKVLTPDYRVLISTLPIDQDPDVLAQKNGKIFLKSVLDNSYDLLDWKWKFLMSSFKKTANSLAKIFENIENFLIEIHNKNVRRAYRTFFDQKIFELKRNIQNVLTPEKTISTEDIIMIIIIKIPDFLENIIEDLMVCQFTNKTYEKIRQDLIDKLTIEEKNSIDTIEYILLKYEKSLQNLLNQKNFSYIIHNRGFALQYLMDTLSVLKRSTANSLE